MIPVIGTSAAISPSFFKSAVAAIGASTFAANFPRDNLALETGGPGLPGILQGAALRAG